MEEEKAAAYYEELVRKGSNAARFKQGLGFGGKVSEVSSSSGIPKSDAAHAASSLSNFVKQSSPGTAAAAAVAFQTETTVDSIRDKLKKKERIPSRDDDDDDSKRENRQESRKDAEHVSSGRGSFLRDRQEGHSNSPDPPGGRRSQRSKHDSPSAKRNVSHSHDSRSLSSSSSEQSSRDFHDRSRRGKHRSPSPRHRRTSWRDSRDDGSRRRSEGQIVRQDRGDSSTYPPTRLKEKSWWRGHRDERDRSRSQSNERRHGDRDEADRSQSQSKERRHRDHRDSSSNMFKERSWRKRQRSHSLSSDSDERSFQHSPRRGRIQSFDKSRKRSRTPRSHTPSHGRKPRDQSHSAERCWEQTRRSSPRDRDRRRRSTSVEKIRKGRSSSRSQEREKGNVGGRSERPGRSSATRVDTSSCRHGRNGDSKTKNEPKVKTRVPDRDFSKLIPNFDSMTPAEKVKAKMKLQLSETVVKDTAKGMTGEWERFDFDKDAPLDNEAKLGYFGDGTGAADDTGHMRNTGSTLLSTANQARREAQIQAAHEAAIFGAPIANAHDTSRSKTKKGGSGHSRRVRGIEEDLGARKRSDVTSLSDEETFKVTTKAPGTGVVSEKIIAMQSAGSWQERAKKMKEVRAAAGSHMESPAS